MVNKAENKLNQLKEKRSVLTARIQKMEALEANRERKQETRRKILVGAYYWDKAKKEGNTEDIKAMMDGYLTRNSDRVLFELEPKDS